MKLKVGDKIYFLDGYAETVTKVGTKYAYTGSNFKYDIKTRAAIVKFRSYSGKHSKFYLSRQEILDELELGDLEYKIRQQFPPYGRKCKLSLDQLRRIKLIIDEKEE